MNIFEILVQQPIINILVVIYQALIAVNLPYALGFAVIALTVLIRFALYPLTASQIHTQKKMSDIAPHLAKLKDKHKGDMKRQQEATMALYKEHGVNPAAGCLPALLQLPIFFGLYTVLEKAVKLDSTADINKFLYSDGINIKKVWDTTFFGLPLGKNPGELLATVGPAILLVVVATALFQFIQSKMMAPATPENKKNLPAVKDEKKSDFANIMQTQMIYMLPLFIGFASYGFPIGLSLYWNTFSLFGIIQQYLISGWGGMTGIISKLKINK